MKKFIALFTLLFSLQSQAALLTVKLDTDQFKVGDAVIADIWISELTEPLAAFDLALLFDSNIFQFNQLVFGDKLTVFAPTIQDQSVSGNLLSLSELNWDAYDYELAALQGTEFKLANIRFTAIGGGIFNLTLDSFLLTAASGFEFDASLIKVTNAQGNVVPAPATALLLLPGLWFLARRRAAVSAK